MVRIAIACAAGLLLSHAASATVIRKFHISNWVAEAYSSDRTGSFDNCSASTSTRTPMRIILVLNAKYEWSIWLRNYAWQLTSPTFDIVFAVDNAPPISARALTISGTLAVVQRADNAALVQRFSTGHELKVSATGQVYSFDLTHTARVASALHRCVAEYGSGHRSTHQ